MKDIKIERSITRRAEDSLERYLQEISRFPLLKGEEEVILAKKISSGDKAALERLVNCNLRFVVSVAKKYEIEGMPLADLISEGNIGLVKAAKRFDESRGFKFISYAVWWIRQAILYSIGLHKRTIRLPMNQLGGIMDLWRSEDLLEQQLHRLPTLDELTEFMGIPDERVLDYLSNSADVFSLDMPLEDAEEGPRVSTMSDPAAVSPDAGLEREAFHINIQRMMNVLSPRDQNILRLAYGMGGGRPLPNEDISNLLGLSSETIRRAKQKALFRLREMKEVKMMLQYL
ncbi:MAG: RNA polymerase sigma factor RpoD/SigA [Candidatus Pedobacter colombiensis]|uniref:RNA polymerase sigma factor RpoD/SigA n=1 Tax=Candidatus Pedobacter colombiensis TaxID=3121371 RepID=A0AAJ5WBN9_9SPHI|nr:RNA polymerase sigma factor RpoD/SigA [Pedobacter sp.]WEK20650.1 MAG: RNA polymerase sigma factor RpoD/SigA [Pedobacter sp.]